MASKFNAKQVSWDGKTKLILGEDENSKIIEGKDNEFIIKNTDGSYAFIAPENIPGMPDNVNEDNKLVTQNDLKEMMKNINDIIESANNLAKIVGGFEDGGN